MQVQEYADLDALGLGQLLRSRQVTAEEVLATPDDFYTRMGLAEVISSLRLRGMGAILARLKRQVREQVEARGGPVAPPG